jgi:hypothetical protein
MMKFSSRKPQKFHLSQVVLPIGKHRDYSLKNLKIVYIQELGQKVLTFCILIYKMGVNFLMPEVYCR